ncbi:MAG: DUF2199 domain-containing protein [Mucilaginibacter sp.]|uniref:DUF2199 domain-containing protein n=1 Tax=Mucilaginibacter sp. TaxID=1882438 RepID=UPI003262D8DB
MKYICENCGNEHESWPALTFNAPLYYDILSSDEKETIAIIESDFCTIENEDHTDRFIRVTLVQTITDHCEDLAYDLWVSLSEKSFNNYVETHKNKTPEPGYFGFLSNQVPGYPDTLNIHMDVYPQSGHQRPIIEPHQNFDHPFVRDYYNGISKEEAERRIKAMMGE